MFYVKDANDNDKVYYESLEARRERGINSWSSLTHMAITAGMTLDDDGVTLRDNYHNTWTFVDAYDHTPEGSVEKEKEEEEEEDYSYDSGCDYQKAYNKSDEEEEVGPDMEGTLDDSDDA